MDDRRPNDIGAEDRVAPRTLSRASTRGVSGNGISLMVQALCLAIISASATVRAPSSIRKPLSCPALAPWSAASPACRARSGVSGLPDENLLGRSRAAMAASRGRRSRSGQREPCRPRMLQGDRRGSERESIGFTIADLVVGRGSAQRRGRHADAQDQFVRLERRFDLGRGARLAMELVRAGSCAGRLARARRLARRRLRARSPSRPG